MRIRLLGVTLLTLLAVVAANAASDDAPEWLRQAANQKCPTYDKDVTAVVLVNDDTVTVDADGRLVRVYNFAVRILRREGREYAEAHVGYVPDSGKVKELHAWLIRGDGEAKRYGKNETLDIAGRPNDVYNEYRVKMILA